MNWTIWLIVPIVYGLFLAWYYNWSGPLSQNEIENFMTRFAESEGTQQTDAAAFRKFLVEDDGKEFVMLNQVQLHTSQVEHPETGKKLSASDLIYDYFKPFAVGLFKRGGHPVFQARTVGGNIDSWNAEQNVDFGATAMMRYRSRRDLVELVMDPAFTDSHIYKLTAIERTVSYPTQIMLSTSLRPPAAVLVILLLLASLAQNISYFVRSTGSG